MTSTPESADAANVADAPHELSGAPIQPVEPVWLVGAGPGDPDLLTVRAARVIAEADVLLVDDLVDRRVLDLARPGVRVLAVGKRGGCASTDQAFIHQLMVREARRGQRVVRLKGGDPFVFGRGGEECDALRAAGIPVEVVSGLTAGVAAPASIGIPVTDRRCAPGVAFVTGHGQDGGSGPDWAALVKSRLTIVVYMGLSTAADLVATLRRHGMADAMPTAVIAAAHTPRQRSARATLATLVETIDREQLASPAILVFGSVAALGVEHAAALADAADVGEPTDVATERRSTSSGRSIAASGDDQPVERRVTRRFG